MSAAIADKLDEARALIEKGWCQGGYTDNLGRFCTLGAICQVVHGHPDADMPGTLTREFRQLCKFILNAVGKPNARVGIWNDAHERTQAEVIEAFRKAAELARAEAQ